MMPGVPATPATVRPQRDAELELTIDSLAHGGAGVARVDGYVVFVRDAVPGDRVRARITKSKRAFGEARTLEVLSPGPDRVEPVADHPGAPWQVLRYEAQLAAKTEQVEDALRRIGGLDGFEVEPIVPADDRWRYRNKLEYSFGTGDAGELVCGFHAPGRWDRIEPLTDCLLASEPGNAVRERVLEWCRGEGLSAYDRRGGDGLLRNLVVREGRASGQLQARLVTSPGALDGEALARAARADGVLRTVTAGVAETTAEGETELIAGVDALDERVGDLQLRVSPNAFFQTNTEMAARLYGVVAEYAALRGFERVFDLYCGIGTIGLTLAVRAGEVWGLDVVEEAIADAIANAELNEIDNTRFFAGNARLAMRELAERAGRPDLVVLDPPRAGLSQKIVRRVLETTPARIVYVSCNPTTLAPNARQLVDAGYRLERVRPVDLFPQTPHIECVALFERD